MTALRTRLKNGMEIGLFLALYTTLFVLRFLHRPDGWIADEELHSPTVAALLAAGEGWDQLLEFQYTPFCGGCTAETLLSTPLMALFGPSLWVWKLIPLLFGLLLVGMAYQVAFLAGGRVAARVTASALILAPTYFAANGMVAFGSHFEVSSLLLISLLQWHRWMTTQRGRDGFYYGLLAGLCFWFAYTSAFALPVLVCLWAIGRRRALLSVQPLLLTAGLGLGLLPWALTQWSLRQAGAAADAPVVSVYAMGPLTLLSQTRDLAQSWSEAVGWLFWVSSWQPLFGVAQPLPGLVTTLVAWSCCLLTLWVGLFGLGKRLTPVEEGAVRSEVVAVGLEATAHPRALVIALALLTIAYLGAYLWLSPRANAAVMAPLPANAMRYLVPLWVLLSLCVGVAVAWLWRGGARARMAGLAAVLVIPGVGLTSQLAGIRPDDLSWRGVGLCALDPGSAAFRLKVSAAPEDPAASQGRAAPEDPTTLGGPAAPEAPATLEDVASRDDPLASVAHDSQGTRSPMARARRMWAEAPEAGAARTVWLYKVGQILGTAAWDHVLGLEKPVDWAWLAGQSEGDQAVILTAMVDVLGPAIPWSPEVPTAIAPTTRTLLSEAGPLEETLARALFRFQVRRFLAPGLVEKLVAVQGQREVLAPPSTGAEARLTRSLAWGIGFGSARRESEQPGEAASQAMKILALSRALALPLRVAFVAGAWEALGEQWGYSSRAAGEVQLVVSSESDLPLKRIQRAFWRGAMRRFCSLPPSPMGSQTTLGWTWHRQY